MKLKNLSDTENSIILSQLPPTRTRENNPNKTADSEKTENLTWHLRLGTARDLQF